MPEDDGEIVFVANNRGGYSKVYHTDPDCRLLEQANGVRERPLSMIHTRRECKYCAGEHDTGGAGDGHFKSLLDAAEDESTLVTDGGRRRWRADADATRTLAGVGDQDTTCPNGDPECAKPGTPPCFDCLMNGGES